MNDASPALPDSAPASADAARRCHNCTAALAAHDVYCHECGQETHIGLPTARQFMREAAGRYVALDGRMWRTLRALAHPGMLTREYLAGRRRRYVRPGRLFLVTSIVAFTAVRLATHNDLGMFDAAREEARAEHNATGMTQAPSTAAAGTKSSTQAVAVPRDGTQPTAAPAGGKANDPDNGVIMRADNYNLSFDDDLNLHVDGPGPVVELLRDRVDNFNRMPREVKGYQLMASAFRYGPYAAIALLPAFALMLKLVYLFSTQRWPGRPRRFAAHLVFAAHSHVFLFLTTAILVVLPWPGWVRTPALFAAAYYLLRSMRVVYGGGWLLTLLRAGVLVVLYALAFALVTVGLLAVAIVTQ
ncbi:MAG: DUF3667 domain-containing protein [Casimicrobiaceae bacterium]